MATSSTDIRLCGPLHARMDGEDLTERLPGRQGRRLFAFLVSARGRGTTRDQLIGAIWGERAPADPDAGLATVLSRLRRVIGPERLPVADTPAIVLPDDARVDVEEAERSRAAAEAALAAGDTDAAASHAQAVLAITRSTFLPGLEGDWIDRRRDQLEEERLAALAVLAEAANTPDVAAGGERAARELVQLAPYRESSHVLLMRSLQHQGEAAEALRAYENARVLLRDELGMNPGAELRALHAELLSEGDDGRVRPDVGISREEDSASGAGDAGSAPPANALRLPPAVAQAARGPIAGRDDALTALREAFASRDQARPSLAVVKGEAGIGKTRLIAELGRIEHAAGASVLYGRSSEDSLVPYGPWTEALREYVSGADDRTLAAWAESNDTRLTTLVPDLSRRLPGLSAPDTLDPDADRFRLLDAVAGLLDEAAADTPLILLLEDMHWADHAGISLLAHVMRFARRPLFIVLTTRASGLDSDHPLARAVVDLERDADVLRLTLYGLDTEAISQLSADLPDAGADPDLPQRLLDETGGNPFFLQGLIRQPRPLGAVPDSVRGAVERRLIDLDEDLVSALRTSSVLGRSFSADVLAVLLESSEDDLLDTLDGGVDVGLLLEEPGAGYRFSFAHALIRTTLYDGLGSARRARLHCRAAAALREMLDTGRPVSVTEVAHHLIAAGSAADPRDVVDFSRRAADEAAAQLAHDEAAEHLRAARTAMEGVTDATPAERADLIAALGDACNRGGDTPGAQEAFLAVAALARDSSDPELLARAALGYGGAGWGGVWWGEFGVADPTLIGLLREAAAGLEPEGAVRASVLGRLSTELYWAGEAAERDALSLEAVDLAERCGDEATVAFALGARHVVLWGPEHVEERTAIARRMLEIGLSLSEPAIEAMGRSWLVVDLLEEGDLAGVDEQINAHSALTRRMGLPVYRWNAALFEATRVMIDGPLERAEELVVRAQDLGLPVQEQNAQQAFGVQLFMVRRLRGGMEDLAPALAQYAELYPAVPAWRAGLAFILCESGRPDEARPHFESVMADLDAVPRDVGFIPVMSWLSETAWHLGDAAAADTLYELLAPRAPYVGVISNALGAVGPAGHHLGMLATTAERWDIAEGHFAAALELDRRVGADNWVADTAMAWALMCERRGGEGDAERARELSAEALEIAARNGLGAVERKALALSGVG